MLKIHFAVIVNDGAWRASASASVHSVASVETIRNNGISSPSPHLHLGVGDRDRGLPRRSDLGSVDHDLAHEGCPRSLSTCALQ